MSASREKVGTTRVYALTAYALIVEHLSKNCHKVVTLLIHKATQSNDFLSVSSL